MCKVNETNGSDAAMKKSQANENKCPESAAVEETIRLYHAWLGYLLTRQGEQVLRVGVEDIRRALDALSCRVTREGEEYVICLQGAGGREVHEPSRAPDRG